MSEHKLTAQQGQIVDILGRQEYRVNSDATALSIAGEVDPSRVSVAGTLGSLIRLGLVQRARRKGTNYYELTSQGLEEQGYRETSRRIQKTTGDG